MVSLDIFSDPICPWCYIGKAQLDQALTDRPDHPFKIAWHPFQLNPDMPAEGMDRRAYMAGKFGDTGAAEAEATMAQAAADVGLTIDFDAIPRTPNTLDAHRLIHWAGIEGAQEAVVDALFAAHFRQGRDISDHDTLADIADAAGLDAAIIHRLLASDSDLQEMRDRDTAARDMGLTGVPTFIVAGDHAVPGAQPADLWRRVIDEMPTGA